MTEENKERLLDLVDAYKVAGDMDIERRDYIKIIEALLRDDKSADDFFEYYIGSINDLNVTLDECGYEGV